MDHNINKYEKRENFAAEHSSPYENQAVALCYRFNFSMYDVLLYL